MNRKILEYKAYQMLLESNLTDRQRQILIEANILQRIGDFFGAAKDWVDSPLGTLFSDKKLGRRMQTSLGNVKKEVDQLKDIAREAQKDEKEIVAAFISGILKQEGITSSDLNKSSNTSGNSNQEQSVSSDELPAGKKISTTNKNELRQALVQLLADITGKPIENVADETNKKSIDVKSLVSTIAKQASSKINVPADKISKVVEILFQKGHISTE